jgi:hypothetical protein
VSASSTYTPTPPAAPARSVTDSRLWAASGVVAGIAGLAYIFGGQSVGAVYDDKLTPVQQVDALADQTPTLIVLHVLTMLMTVAILPFAAGLTRRLRIQAPAGSLLPTVAASGLGLVAVAGLMGAALNTEFLFGMKQMPTALSQFYGHWIGTVPWLWVGAGVAGVALAVAALRHGAAPRWIGWVSVVLGGVTLLFGISPLEYMAGMTGPIWLTVVAIGFLSEGSRKNRA